MKKLLHGQKIAFTTNIWPLTFSKSFLEFNNIRIYGSQQILLKLGVQKSLKLQKNHGHSFF